MNVVDSVYTLQMMKYFWSTILLVNSIMWFLSLAFLSFAFGMLIVALDWRQFLLAFAIFVAVSLSEVVITALAH